MGTPPSIDSGRSEAEAGQGAARGFEVTSWMAGLLKRRSAPAAETALTDDTFYLLGVRDPTRPPARLVICSLDPRLKVEPLVEGAETGPPLRELVMCVAADDQHVLRDLLGDLVNGPVPD